MKRYRIVLSKSAAKELDRLTSKSHDKIIARLHDLQADPRLQGSGKLRGINAYKLRVGNFRIVYQIDDAEKEVRIVMVEDRKQVYQRLKRKS